MSDTPARGAGGPRSQNLNRESLAADRIRWSKCPEAFACLPGGDLGGGTIIATSSDIRAHQLSVLEAWALTGTTPVDVTINGVAVERRNVKFWDAAKWFFNITVRDCKKVGIDTGDTVELVISPVGSL